MGARTAWNAFHRDSSAAQMFNHILVPIEIWDPGMSARVLASAAAIARPTNASVLVLTILPDNKAIQRYKFSVSTFEEAAAAVKQELDVFVARHFPKDLKWQSLVLRGDIYRKILEVADEQKADLIVLAAHSHRVGDFLIGSNAERVARHARCSVFLVRGNPGQAASAVIPPR